MRWVICILLLSAASAQEQDVKSKLQRAAEEYREAIGLCGAGRYLEAERLFQHALAIHRRLPAGNENYIVAELHNLGLIARKRGAHQQSLDLLNESLTMNRERTDAHATAHTLIEIANTYRVMDKPYEADPVVREAIQLSEQLAPPDPKVYAIACNTYGALHIQLQDVEGAGRWFRRALDAVRTLPDTEPEIEASVLANLAAVQFAAGHGQESLDLFRQSIAMQEKYLGPTHPKLAETLASYSSVLKRLRHKDEAAAVNRRATQIRNSLLPQR